jgi:phosphoglycolate phosphatase
VIQLLSQLQKSGIICFIATNKPRHLTENLLDIKKIRQYFTDWMCTGDNNISNKADLIFHLLDKYNLPPTQCIFIGDTVEDMLAAKKTGVRSVAHISGYGKKEELLACNPTFTIEHMAGLETILLPSAAPNNTANI